MKDDKHYLHVIVGIHDLNNNKNIKSIANEYDSIITKKDAEKIGLLASRRENIIVNDFNLTIKDRRMILNTIKPYKESYHVIALVLYTNWNKIKNYQQLTKFQIPFAEEGFDEIKYQGDDAAKNKRFIEETFSEMSMFDQKSLHHSNKLGVHCELSQIGASIMGLSPSLRFGARYHDVGKMFTQTIDDCGNAHYYSHENVGAYYMLAHIDDIIEYSGFTVAELSEAIFLINYHMYPSGWTTPKSIRKWKRIFGDYKFDLLLKFHEIDIYAKHSKGIGDMYKAIKSEEYLYTE